MILIFLTLTELIYLALGNFSYLLGLFIITLTNSIGLFPKSGSAIFGASILQISAYILPALLAWAVLYFIRSKWKISSPVSGRHWLTAGLLCAVASHAFRFVIGSKIATIWLLTALSWSGSVTIPLLIIGLVLFLRSLKPKKFAEAQENVT